MMPAQSKRAITGKGITKNGADAEGSDHSQIQLVSQQQNEPKKLTTTGRGPLDGLDDDDFDDDEQFRLKMVQQKKSKVITRENLMFGKIPDPKSPLGFEEKLSIMDHQNTSRSFEQQSERAKKKRANRPFLEMIIISPHWMPYQLFKMVIIPLCIVSSFLYAYFAAFRYDVDGFCFPAD